MFSFWEVSVQEIVKVLVLPYVAPEVAGRVVTGLVTTIVDLEGGVANSVSSESGMVIVAITLN